MATRKLASLKGRFYVLLHDKDNSPLDFELQGGVLKPEMSDFAEKVCDLILDYLSGEDAEAVADQTDTAIPAGITQMEQGRAAASTIWSLILEVVYHFTYNHPIQDKIVNLLHAYTELPEEDLDTSLSDGTFQWKTLRDLPDLNFRLGDVWRGHWPSISWDLDETDTEDEEQASLRRTQWDLWLKLNSFVARIFALNLKQTQQYCTEAVWTLRSTVLEQRRQNPKQIEREVTLCSAWISYAGQQLYSMRTEDGLSESETKSLRGGPLYAGRPGLCQERWEFWQKRLLEIADSDLDFSAQAKQLARQTAAKMREIQTTGV